MLEMTSFQTCAKMAERRYSVGGVSVTLRRDSGTGTGFSFLAVEDRRLLPLACPVSKSGEMFSNSFE
jgi:hypothetical protein